MCVDGGGADATLPCAWRGEAGLSGQLGAFKELVGIILISADGEMTPNPGSAAALRGHAGKAEVEEHVCMSRWES